MYNNGIWTAAMTDMFETGGESFGTALSSGGVSVGAYGFTWNTGVYTEGSGVLGGDMSLGALGEGNGYFAFNPYVFAAMVVIAVIQNLAACTTEEQMLSMHKGASLSVYINTVCTKTFLGTCVAYKDNYCSFNSVLAKIINIQGKPQLGLELADCKGFTTAQVSQLDFKKIDFSEFSASMLNQAQKGLPSSSTVQAGYGPTVNSLIGGSAQTGNMATNSNVLGGLQPASPPPPNPANPTYPPPGGH